MFSQGNACKQSAKRTCIVFTVHTIHNACTYNTLYGACYVVNTGGVCALATQCTGVRKPHNYNYQSAYLYEEKKKGAGVKVQAKKRMFVRAESH